MIFILKTLLFYILIMSYFISCHRFNFPDFFNKNSQFTENTLPSKYEKKEPIRELALEIAKKSIWEVSLYLNFQTKQIDFSKNKSEFDIDIESTHKLIHLGHGSGFFISPNLMVTNFHVIDYANQHIEIISNKDSENSNELLINNMKLLKVSSLYDLALLESETESPYFLNIKTEPIQPNKDSFFLLGYPDNRFIFSPVQYNSSHLDRRLILFDRKTSLGQLTGTSGGPIIDQNGNVVAVNQSGSDEISIGISSTILNSFLNGNNRDCSEISLDECLQEEWSFLDRAYQDGNLMAKHRIATSKSYENWLNKKEKLNQLIENREEINRLEEKLAEALEDYGRDKTVENRDSYKRILEEHKKQVELYNKTVSDLNKFFF